MTDSERIIYQPTSVGAGMGSGFGGFGQGGLLEGLILASLLGRNGGGLFGGNNGGGASELAGDIAANVVQLQNSGDIKEEIAASQAQLLSKMCCIDKEAMAAGMEAKIASLQSTNEITNKIGAVQTEIQSVKCTIDSKIAASTQAILNQLQANVLEQKNDEIAMLRAGKGQLEQTLLFSNQLNSIGSMISNLSAKQDVANSAINFGNGTIQPQTVNSNQVTK
jgi:uncharacterized small protein (DUF1192 family)